MPALPLLLELGRRGRVAMKMKRRGRGLRGRETDGRLPSLPRLVPRSFTCSTPLQRLPLGLGPLHHAFNTLRHATQQADHQIFHGRTRTRVNRSTRRAAVRTAWPLGALCSWLVIGCMYRSPDLTETAWITCGEFCRGCLGGSGWRAVEPRGLRECLKFNSDHIGCLMTIRRIKHRLIIKIIT